MLGRPGQTLRTGIGLLACLGSSGCTYFADRALDFVDPYRIVIGASTGVGVRTSNLGLIDTGLMFGLKPRAGALGWKYGTPLHFLASDRRVDIDQAEIFMTTSVRDLDYTTGAYASARNSAFVLPALLSWVDATPTGYEWQVPDHGALFDDRFWIWGAEGFRANRYTQVHAFDTELELRLFVYLDTGFSIGEWFDFLLGWFLIDIAGDDGRLAGK